MEGVGDGAPAEELKKPALLKGGMILCWINAAALALYVWAMPGIDELVKQQAAAVRKIPGMAPGVNAAGGVIILGSARVFVIPVLGISIIVAYGLAKNRHWSRWTMMMLLVLGIVLMPPAMANTTDYVISIAVAGFGWWYLYRKSNVVAYYDAIKTTATERDARL